MKKLADEILKLAEVEEALVVKKGFLQHGFNFIEKRFCY